jgi:hypothetical protein
MNDFTGQKSSNYQIELARGNISGQSSASVLGRNIAVSATLQDIWDAGGELVYPTAGEQWEILSSDTNDTSAGTGAQTVVIQYLDDNYVEQAEVLTMNGTTAVDFVAIDAFRFRRALVFTAGSGDINAGDITIRPSGGGNTRGQIKAGNGNSLDGHFTVPADKAAYLVFVYTNVNKSEDAEITLKSTLSDGTIFTVRFPLSNYQNSVVSPVSLPPRFHEKSDLKITAVSTNSATIVSVALQFVMVDELDQLAPSNLPFGEI